MTTRKQYLEALEVIESYHGQSKKQLSKREKREQLIDRCVAKWAKEAIEKYYLDNY